MTKFIKSIILFFGLACTCWADKLYDTSVVTVIGASVADIVSSRRPGLVETNPILGNSMNAKAIAIKSGITGAGLFLTYRLYKTGHKKMAAITNFVMAGGTAGVAVHNFEIGR